MKFPVLFPAATLAACLLTSCLPASDHRQLVDGYLTDLQLGRRDAAREKLANYLEEPDLHSVHDWSYLSASGEDSAVANFRLAIEAASPVTGAPTRENWKISTTRQADGKPHISLIYRY